MAPYELFLTMTCFLSASVLISETFAETADDFDVKTVDEEERKKTYSGVVMQPVPDT